MSSRAAKIRKKLNGTPDPLYNSPIGSVVSAISILTGHNTEDARQLFMKMKKLGNKLPCNTIRGICDFVYSQYGYEEYKPHAERLVLVTDNYGIRSPMVTFVTVGDEDSSTRIMPIDPSGFHEVNILSLAAQGRDWIEIEFIYDVDEVDNDESKGTGS